FLYRIILISLLCLVGLGKPAAAEVYVLASVAQPLNEIELKELRSIYKGRLSQINGQRLVPLNIVSGTADREEFLQRIIGSTDLDYTGYWHVRRYTGQGTPPREVGSHDELFSSLKRNPETIGYLWMPNGMKPRLPEGLKIIRLK
ncbi:MAG TPA: hypothetical protein VFV28_06800, partial [Limnobacter sp.]|nr:hypothetical protein [Limnobacter sp.]